MNFARRIVVDTEVLISAAIRPESIPALALEKAFLLFEVCVCVSTLAELETVLLRAKFDRYLDRAEREAFIAGFRERALMLPVSQTVTDCPDPKDNIFLALADTAQAEMLISSDPHLVDMHPWRGIPILPPAAFLVGIR
jgi:putative PIN family toxin of toxin-antitoxin system